MSSSEEKSATWSRWSGAARVTGAAVPVTMVNATAFIGQFAFLQEHVNWPFPGQVLIAVTFESVAVYLAWQAHMATLANDSSMRLKLGAYLFGVIMGLMNYSHYAAPHLHPTFMAVGMFFMSALSPWLWGIHTRRASRDSLMAKGLVEPHAVRLGANRVMWHPLRSMIVMSRSAWSGENDPKRAIADYDVSRRTAEPRQEPAPEALREVPVPLAQSFPPAEIAPVAAPAIEAAPAPLAPPAPEDLMVQMPVRAIAALTAQPKLNAVHPISASRRDEVSRHLAALPASQLPSEREVAALLCDEGHNHRRPAKVLIDARRALGEAPVPPAAPRLRRVGDPSVSIASPASTLPGGIIANG